MKKKYFFMAIYISIISLKANAQMDYIKTFYNRLDPRTVNGEKVFVEEIGDNYNCIGVNIYGTDFTLKKSIRPNVPNLARIGNIRRELFGIPSYQTYSELFTENVFNQDNLLEFIAIIQNDDKQNEVVIVNEYSQILWRKKWDNGITISYYSNNVELFSLDDQNEKFLLSFELTDANNNYFYEYYSVSNSTALRVTKVAETPAPYPNPSKGIIQLTYNLENAPEGIIHIFNTEGQEIRTLKVDGNAETVGVNTSGMASGNYFYSVEADGKQLGKNRFMVK